ncbi:MAG: hypothetical protein WBW84_01735 [Acidobacteriaceae bacterium]
MPLRNVRIEPDLKNAPPQSVGHYFRWLLAATLGNICGGVVLVTLLEYGQVKLD